MSGKLKVTNKRQFECMVDLLEKTPEIGRGKGQFGSSKEQQQDTWNNYAEELNKLGPPMRTGPEWHRVWIHYKAGVKKKLSENKKSLVQTGGGPYTEIPLSAVEKRVAHLVHTNVAVNPCGLAFGVQQSQNKENFNKESYQLLADEIMVDETYELMDETYDLTGEPSSNTLIEPPKKKSKLEKDQTQERLHLLQKQTAVQEKQLEVLQKIEQRQEKVYNMKKEKFEIYQKYMKQKMELQALQIELIKNPN